MIISLTVKPYYFSRDKHSHQWLGHGTEKVSLDKPKNVVDERNLSEGPGVVGAVLTTQG